MKARASIKKTTLVAIFISLALLGLTLAYINFFLNDLTSRNWQSTENYTRIVIPDTYIYSDIVSISSSYLQWAFAGVKNALVPSMLWQIAGSNNWIGMAALNVILVFITLIYTQKILENIFEIDSKEIKYIIIIMGLLPSVLYHSIGALKEIPTLLALTCFFYFFIKKHTIKWLVIAMFIVLLRYQIIFPLVIFICLAKFAKKPFLSAVIIMAVISAIYPVILNFSIFSATETSLFREESTGNIGSIIEATRNTIPIASIPAVLIRTAQSILEPFFTALGSHGFFEGQKISILQLSYLTSLAITIPAWFRFCKHSFLLAKLSKQNKYSREKQLLMALILLYIIPVGGFSFIHYRYIFPVTALLLIASAAVTVRIPEKN